MTLADVREAAKGLEGVAVRTPLKPVPDLSERAGVPVYLKLENLQPTGAFKLRGAWTFVRRRGPAERTRGVVTYSSGNHGQAVAFAAQRVNVRAVVVMPETAPKAKVDGVQRWGGEVVFAGRTSEDRYARAMAIAEADDLTVIPPFEHPHIIAGQGTVGLEIVDDLPEVAMVAVPVGGGGLLAGISTVFKALKSRARIVGVEPAGAAKLTAAIEAGRPVRLEATDSIADGLLPLSIGTMTFAHIKGRASAVTVSDEAIAEATVWLHETLDVRAEPSGGATTAALRSGLLEPKGPVVLVVSGGNLDAEGLADLTNR